MITNFEEITTELTAKELKLIQPLINGFRTHSETNPIKAPEIVEAMNKFLAAQGIKMKMTQPRLRKCVNHIRANSLLPLIATSEGYFVSPDIEVIEAQIKSLEERARSIFNCAEGMKKLIN